MKYAKNVAIYVHLHECIVYLYECECRIEKEDLKFSLTGENYLRY